MSAHQLQGDLTYTSKHDHSEGGIVIQLTCHEPQAINCPCSCRLDLIALQTSQNQRAKSESDREH